MAFASRLREDLTLATSARETRIQSFLDSGLEHREIVSAGFGDPIITIEEINFTSVPGFSSSWRSMKIPAVSKEDGKWEMDC
jgi:hypothetical protein